MKLCCVCKKRERRPGRSMCRDCRNARDREQYEMQRGKKLVKLSVPEDLRRELYEHWRESR